MPSFGLWLTLSHAKTGDSRRTRISSQHTTGEQADRVWQAPLSETQRPRPKSFLTRCAFEQWRLEEKEAHRLICFSGGKNTRLQPSYNHILKNVLTVFLKCLVFTNDFVQHKKKLSSLGPQTVKAKRILFKPSSLNCPLQWYFSPNRRISSTVCIFFKRKSTTLLCLFLSLVV